MNFKHLFIFLLLIFIFSSSVVSALSVVVHIPEKYTDVQAGERVYFEIEIKFPENPSRQDLRLKYEILDEEENTIAQSKVLKAIETQASFIDFIVIPESAETGLHTINVNIRDYADLSEEVSASFHITGGDSSQLKLYFLILLGAVILVGMLVVANIILAKRRSAS